MSPLQAPTAIQTDAGGRLIGRPKSFLEQAPLTLGHVGTLAPTSTGRITIRSGPSVLPFGLPGYVYAAASQSNGTGRRSVVSSPPAPSHAAPADGLAATRTAQKTAPLRPCEHNWQAPFFFGT